MFDMAVAAERAALAGDPVRAAGAWARLLGKREDAALLRHAALAHERAGLAAQASAYWGRYQKVAASQLEGRLVAQRIADLTKLAAPTD